MIGEAAKTCSASTDDELERAQVIAVPVEIIAVSGDGDNPADTFEVETADNFESSHLKMWFFDFSLRRASVAVG